MGSIKYRCYSAIGRVGSKQQISIGLGCERRGTAVHEIGHALGFWHEHTRYCSILVSFFNFYYFLRPDRDNWVQIVYDNIVDGAQMNFMSRAADDIVDNDVPYDYGSIMHYGPTVTQHLAVIL